MRQTSFSVCALRLLLCLAAFLVSSHAAYSQTPFTRTYQPTGSIQVECCSTGLYGFTPVIQDTSLTGNVTITSIAVSDSGSIVSTDPNGVAGTTWEIFVGTSACDFPTGQQQGFINLETYSCNSPTQLIFNTNGNFVAPASGTFSGSYNFVTDAFTTNDTGTFISGTTSPSTLTQGLFAQILLWGGDQGANLTLSDISITVTGTINTGAGPGITSGTGATFGTGVENSFVVTTSGSPTPSITENGTLPIGVNFVDNGNGTGSLSGIPSTTGTFPITVTASNGVSPNATQNFTLSVSGEVASETLTVTLLGGGAGTVSDDTGSLNCSEVSGEQTDASRCVVNYSAGSTVILTATPAEGSGTTFGGWNGACSDSGTSPTCMVSMSEAETVTANFIAGPQSQNLTFNPGTNVVQTAAFNCPGNPNPISPANPCTPEQGPNADAFEVQLAQVFEPFTMTVTRTEFSPTGLCPAGGSVSDPTNFACRFVTFFDYGTDGAGNTIVPICDGYSNGDCVHYDIYYCVPQASGPCVPTPGQEPPPADYVNSVALRISWNNNSFVPPSPTYTGSFQRFYDDPDFAFTPTSAYGTTCGQPMLIGSTPQPYSCQFEFDVTTFFDATGAVDPSIGGTIRQFNDLVVAFPPTVPGTNPVVLPATPSAPTISGSCLLGCTVSSSTVMFVEGAGGTFVVTAKGFPAPTLTEMGTLPSGLSLSTTTGIISGTPAMGSEGNYPITITATNAVGSVTQNYTITVESPLSISPSSVNFGKVYLDTIAVRAVTLTNTGSMTITIGKVNVTAEVQAAISFSKSGDFIDLSLCPSSLAPGKKCVIVVSFIAKGSDFNPQSATLNITVDGIARSVLLTAEIIDPVAKLSTFDLNFGNVRVGTNSSAKTVTLTNVGKTPLVLSGLSISGNFELGPAGTCTSHTSLLEGSSCTISVIFEPTSQGFKRGSVKITDNALIGTQFVALTGNGT